MTGLNDVPVAVDDELSTDEDTPLVIPFATLLLNDTDADEGETASLSVSSLNVLGTTASVRVDDVGIHYDPQGLFDELGTGDAVFETILYTIQDVHGAQSAAASLTIQVTGVNDIPELSLDADGSSGAPEGDFETEFLEGGQAVAIADLDASLTSADEEPVQTLTATLLDGQDADDEGLALTAEGTTIASENSIVVGGEGTHTLSLTGPASSAVMQSLLTEILYQNSAADVTGSDRTIEVTVSDGEDSAQAQTTVQLVSVNDVLPDIVTFRGNRLQLLLNTGTEFERTASIFAPEWDDIQVADFTGDGQDDVIGRTAGGQWQLMDLSTGSVPQVWGQWATDTQWPTVAAADFDNDGLPDIIGRNSENQWWVSRNIGDRFETKMVGQWSATHTWEDVMVADLTGDGRADVVGRTNGGWWLGESTGTKFHTSLRGSWSTDTAWSDVMIGQFQGDALPDIIGRADDGSWWVARNAGFRFETLFVGRWTSVTWSDVMTGDFNNDGVGDLVGRNDDGDWRVTYITESTFDNQAWGHWSSSVTWSDVAANDFTGDGQLDLVARAGDGSWWVTRNQGEGTQFALESWTSSSNVNDWRDSVDGFFAEWEA